MGHFRILPVRKDSSQGDPILLFSRAVLRFTPSDPVQHNLMLRWNGKPLSRNPIRMLPRSDKKQQQAQPQQAAIATSEHIKNHLAGSSEGKVRLTGQGLVSANCNEENHFTIDGSSCQESGRPEVQISGHKTELTVKLKNVGYNLYQAFYTPRTPGTYLLNVFWSGRQVKGCPLKVMAEENKGTNKAVSACLPACL